MMMDLDPELEVDSSSSWNLNILSTDEDEKGQRALVSSWEHKTDWIKNVAYLIVIQSKDDEFERNEEAAFEDQEIEFEGLQTHEQKEKELRQRLEMVIQKRDRCQEWVASHSLENEPIKCTKRIHAEMDDDIDDMIDDDQPVKMKVHKPVRISNLELLFFCEWRHCSYQNRNKYDEFVVHVSSHISELEIVTKEDDSESYLCLWDSCFFESTNSLEITRHVHFHAYHSQLKSAALELHEKWDFPPCKQNEDNRNCLPALLATFCCECLDCEYTTNIYHYFLNHVRNHIFNDQFVKEGRKILCPWRGCKAWYNNKKYRLTVHMKKHTKEKTVACPTCGAFFATNTKYMDHCVRKTPAKVEGNGCQYCWRYFSSERLLKDHMRYHINIYKCSVCEMTCPTRSTLARHVRYRHLNERHFKCQNCNFSCKALDDFNSHLLTHNPVAPYQCKMNKCTFSCRSKVTFRNHLDRVHLKKNERIYCCQLCNIKYNKGSNLTNHLRRVHGIERPAGHSRLRYMRDLDGYSRLQLERYESIDEPSNHENDSNNSNHEDDNFTMEYQQLEESPISQLSSGIRDECSNNDNDKDILIEIDELDEHGNIVNYSTIAQQSTMDIQNIVT